METMGTIFTKKSIVRNGKWTQWGTKNIRNCLFIPLKMLSSILKFLDRRHLQKVYLVLPWCFPIPKSENNLGVALVDQVQVSYNLLGWKHSYPRIGQGYASGATPPGFPLRQLIFRPFAQRCFECIRRGEKIYPFSSGVKNLKYQIWIVWMMRIDFR